MFLGPNKPGDLAEIRSYHPVISDLTAVCLLPDSNPQTSAMQQSVSNHTSPESSGEHSQPMSIDHPSTSAIGSNQIVFDSLFPFSGDLFLGTHETAGKVALKRSSHRGGDKNDVQKISQVFERESNIWMGLRHDRILQCLGMFTQGGHMYLVSPFMENGSLSDWLRHRECSGLDRLRLIHELAGALVYLHSRGVIHGDIKAKNVLLSDDMHVKLGGFDLIKLYGSATTTRLKGVGSARWQSPELWDDEPKSFESDVYAFAMTIVEVLTGDVPFAKLRSNNAVLKVVILGRRPDQLPKASVDGLSFSAAWRVAERCWHESPADRISMKEADEFLKPYADRYSLGTKPFTEPVMSHAESPDASQNHPTSIPLVSVPAQSLRPSTTGAWPCTENLSDQIDFDSFEPFDTRGGFCDIFLGAHKTAGKVALKQLRYRGGGESDIDFVTRQFERESDIWMGLRHDRILQCLGMFTQGGHMYLVSPFMENGSLSDWLRHRECSGLDRLRLIRELAEALVYLHSCGVIHGDVKASNVLLSDDMHVKLCDFGLTKLYGSATTTGLRGAGSIRWQSPELWDDEPKSFKSDVYAFAMTIVEVLVGSVPFATISNDHAVIMMVSMRGDRPVQWPQESPDGKSYSKAWHVAKLCWPQIPADRISMEEVDELFRIYSEPYPLGPEPFVKHVEPRTESHDASQDCPTNISSSHIPVEYVGDQIIFNASKPFNTKGSFCDMFLGEHLTEGKLALKRLRHRGGTRNKLAMIQDFKREKDLWMALRHNRILQCRGSFTDERHLYLVSPFMKNGSLSEWILSEKHAGLERIRLIHELADALLYLHSLEIVHGDVKAQNVVLSDDMHVQLCDFGLSRHAESPTEPALKGVGASRWQSPELMDDKPKSMKSDVYAFAMTIVEVLTRERPFATINNDKAVIKAVFIRGQRPNRSPKTSPDGTSYSNPWTVAEQGWKEDPSQRISMAGALKLLRLCGERYPAHQSSDTRN